MSFLSRLLLAVALLAGLLGMHGVAMEHGHPAASLAVMADGGAHDGGVGGCAGPCEAMRASGVSCTPAPGPAAPVIGAPPGAGLLVGRPMAEAGVPVAAGGRARTPSLVELGISRT